MVKDGSIISAIIATCHYKNGMKLSIKITILTFLLASCSAPRLAFQDNVSFDELSIAFTFEEGTAEVLKKGFSQSMDRFITSHNSNGEFPFKLKLATDTTSNNLLSVNLLGTKLVSRGEQTAGVLVSALGLALPFIMVSSGSEFYVFFYYFPKDVSVFEMSLSPDISSPEIDKLDLTLANSGFLRSVPKQIDLHTARFEYFMRNIMRTLVSDYER